MKVRGAEGLYNQLRNQQSKGQKFNIGRLEASAEVAVKLAMFHNGQPVNEQQYLDIATKAIDQGQILQEVGLYMVTLDWLRDNEPEKFQAWTDSKFKTTTFRSGVNAKLNKLVDPENKVRASPFFEWYEELLSRDRIVEIPQPIVDAGDYGPQFRAAISNYLVDDIFDKISESHGSDVGVYGRTIDGQEILLVGKIRQKNPFELKDDPNPPYSFTTTKNKGAETFKVTPYERPIADLDMTGLENAQKPSSFDVGHSKAESTQIMQKKLNRIKETRDIASRDGNKDVADYLSNMIIGLEKVIDNAVAVDKLYATQSALSSRNYGVEFDKFVAMAAGLGADEILIVEETAGGQLSARKVTGTVTYSASVFTSEISRGNQGFKSGRQNSLKSQFDKVVQGILDVSGLDLITTEHSSSFLHMLLLKNLSKIFDDRSFEKLIKKPGKSTKANSVKIRNKDILKTNKMVEDAKKHKRRIQQNIKQLKKGPSAATLRKVHTPRNPLRKAPESKAPTNYSTYGVISMMNNIIYQYVIRQMVYPSLVNRTGRFARSVKVTNITDQGALMYTYQRSPYQVFSSKYGKFPWNDPSARNPENIIDAAIREMAVERFADFFVNIHTIGEF